jgi:hypothetical protein
MKFGVALGRLFPEHYEQVSLEAESALRRAARLGDGWGA